MADQDLTCTDDLQQCTYECKSGFVDTSIKNAVKECQLNGIWSGPDLTCSMLSFLLFLSSIICL